MNAQSIINSLEYLIKNAGEFGCEDLAEVRSVEPMLSSVDQESAMIEIELPEGKFLISVKAVKSVLTKSAGEN